MEFSFDLNELFPGSITKFNNDLQIINHNSKDVGQENPRRYLGRTLEEHLCEIIDKLGILSAKAQYLKSPITTSLKFQNSDHCLYIMKEDDGARGKIVGFIKVGPKNLLLSDEVHGVKEFMPLCLLDFYIHESRQRKGLGKTLFDFMLQSENKQPVELAIDRPSDKCLLFFGRHFNMVKSIPQANNFVIFEGFFENYVSCGSDLNLTYGQRGAFRHYPQSFMKNIMNHDMKDPSANHYQSGKKRCPIPDDRASIFEDDASVSSHTGKKLVPSKHKSTISEIFQGDENINGRKDSLVDDLPDNIEAVSLVEKELSNLDEEPLSDKLKVEKYLDDLNNVPNHLRECPTALSDCQSESSFHGSEYSAASGPLRSGKRRALHNHSPLW